MCMPSASPRCALTLPCTYSLFSSLDMLVSQAGSIGDWVVQSWVGACRQEGEQACVPCDILFYRQLCPLLA